VVVCLHICSKMSVLARFGAQKGSGESKKDREHGGGVGMGAFRSGGGSTAAGWLGQTSASDSGVSRTGEVGTWHGRAPYHVENFVDGLSSRKSGTMPDCSGGLAEAQEERRC
jgi:hypothetical protein